MPNIKVIEKNDIKFIYVNDISTYLYNNTGFLYDVEHFLQKTKKKINYLYDQEEFLLLEIKYLYDIFDHFEATFDHDQNVKIKNIKKHLRSIGIYKTKRRLQSCKIYVMYKQTYRCNICHNILTPYCEIDHIIALQNGGLDEISNLQALCNECHNKKTYREKFGDFEI